MADYTRNFNLRKDNKEDYYSIDVVNSNLDKIDSAMESIKIESENKNGGDADTLNGKDYTYFAKAEHSHNYLPLTGGTVDNILEVNGELDLNGTLFAEDITASRDISAGTFSGDGSNLTNVNAHTIGGKTAAYLQNYNNLTNKPSSLPANGGNADTVDGKHASDLQNYNNLTNKPSSLPADGGIAAGIKIPNEGAYTTDQYGNFRHNSDNTQNTWNIVSGEGANKFSVNFENGNVSTFGTIKAENFSGDGSGITNVNAKTVMNRGIEEIQTRDRGYSFWSANKDWNDITVPGYYGLMHSTSSALHNPVNGTFFYPFVFKYADDAMTQLAIPHISGNKDDRGLMYIRSKNPSYNGWSDWKALGETNQFEKTFSSSNGSWYRLAKGKLNSSSYNSGACGIMTIMADMYMYHSSAVISVTQNGADGSFTILNLSSHNEFFKKFRMAQGTDGYMYIDGYTEIKGDSVKFTFTFSGIGWKVCENIVSVNSGFGNVVMTKEPILN